MDKHSGFTLIELLISIVVLAVVLALGIPGLQDFIKNNRVTTQNNGFIIAIQVARSEAVKRGTGAVICAANAALDGCSNDTDWSTGWIVFTDLNQNADLTEAVECPLEVDFDTKDCILRKDGPLTKSSMTADSPHLKFLPNGLVDNGPVTFTLRADDCNDRQQRAITITRQGHPISTKQVCS